MLKIGFIGLGGGGGNLAKLSAEANIESLAINSSVDDLDTIDDYVETLAVGTDGCGKDQNLAVKMIKNQFANILEACEIFKDYSVVFVGHTGGGGFGSGSSFPVIKILCSKYPNVLFIPITMIADIKESSKSLTNSVKCISKIYDMDLSYMIYDNSRVNSNSVKTVYDSINKAVIDSMKILRGDYCESSQYGNMDDRDRMKLLSTKGMMSFGSITGIKEENLDSISLDDMIIKSIKDSYNISFERDKIVKRMGFIISLPENLLSSLDRSYSKISEAMGYPLEIFEHINVIDEGEPGSIITILSGLTYPDTRISEITETLNSRKEHVTKTRETNIDDILSGVSWIDDEDDLVKNEKVENIEDILKDI